MSSIRKRTLLYMRLVEVTMFSILREGAVIACTGVANSIVQMVRIRLHVIIHADSEGSSVAPFRCTLNLIYTILISFG